MRRFLKWIATGTVAAYVILAATALTISSCVGVDFEMKPTKVDAYFQARDIEPRFETYTHQGRPMHYVSVGDEDKPLVVFVHGSPGSWDAFISFLGDDDLRARARLVSVDRPGFGKSGKNIPERSLVKQAADIRPILETNRSSVGAILVGHSLGGPLIARMAMDFPELVGGLIMVAPSIDPTLEKTKWYQVPADWAVFSWMIPEVLLTTNREILPLKAELEAMVPRWGEIRVPVTVIQGGKDRLVPPGNADFAARVLVNAPLEMVRIADMNHFVPWTRPDLITDAIEAQLDKLVTADGMTAE